MHLNILVDFKALRIIIRADGRLSEIDGIQIPGRVARLDDGKDSGYIIDIRDTQDEWANQRAHQREQFYQEQGWEEATIEEMLDDLRATSELRTEDSAGQCEQDQSGEADGEAE